MRLDDIEDFSEDRNHPLPTTERPTHKNVRIKNEPNLDQLHVSFATEIRSSPNIPAHRPVLVKKERTPQKSILKHSNTKTSISKDNTVGKKRKRTDQIKEIYTDSVIDDYDVSDSVMYTYSYDDINLHNIEPVYNTTVDEVRIKEEIPSTDLPHNNNNTTTYNNSNINTHSDLNKKYGIHSEISRVPDSLADVILAKDSQPPQQDAPTPSKLNFLF